MINQDFFDAIFPDFWATVDRSRVEVDQNSMFADEAVFSWLIKCLKPSSIIEIGSWKGHSANYMADVTRSIGLDTKIVCVDTFLGASEHWLQPGAIDTLNRVNGQPTIINSFIGNVIDRKNDGRVFPLCLDSRSASHVLKRFNFKADLVFIDGAHDYPDVVDDIMNYFPILSDIGVMWGDDYQHEPLARAVHDCATKLGMKVIVSSRKWIYLNESLLQKIGLPDIQLRESFDGWIHP